MTMRTAKLGVIGKVMNRCAVVSYYNSCCGKNVQGFGIDLGGKGPLFEG